MENSTGKAEGSKGKRQSRDLKKDEINLWDAKGISEQYIF